ncbi:hypothetical protein MTR67_006032 [Solanum verrucosum]|uniref:Terpene synthase metal-binding domain-containing protein n=1 Tax=Solanum verrucosum TaxID=315347 RepID=A0AAF0PXH4_SOLVR|nr:hypothetical protein MTR67_006032 [Solanum verrucosum]
MENGWISIGGPVVLVHTLFLVTNPITKEALDSLTNYPDIIRWSSTVIRLADDLGTSSDEMERGDVPKSIQCYMNKKDVSEEDARKHINLLIKETWKLMNTVQNNNSLFSETFIGCAVNGARTSQTIYQHGDGYGIQNSHTKNRISINLKSETGAEKKPFVGKQWQTGAEKKPFVGKQWHLFLSRSEPTPWMWSALENH